MCDLLRSMTALAQSMHQHLVATNVWRYRHRQGRVEMQKAVAAKQARPVRTLPREIDVAFHCSSFRLAWVCMDQYGVAHRQEAALQKARVS